MIYRIVRIEMNNLNIQITQLATTTVDVTSWCQHLECKIARSLKDVEFFVAYGRTKGKDLSKAINEFSNRVNADRRLGQYMG